MEQAEPDDGSGTGEEEENVPQAAFFQGLSFFRDDQRYRCRYKSEEQRAYFVYMFCEHAFKKRDGQPHADEPADSEAQEKEERFFALFFVLADDISERADKVAVDPGKKSHGSSRNAGDTVRDRHEKAADRLFQNRQK